MLGLQQVIDGVALGGAYALAALGLALIYRVMRFIQLSHGQLVTLGAYVGWWASSAMGSLTAAFLVTAAAMAAFGAVLYLSLFKRMLGYSHLSPLMVALGLSLIIQETLRILVQNGNPVQYSRQMGGDVAWDIGGYFVIPSQLGVLLLAVVLVLATALFISRSRWGICMRAVAASPDAAELLGINTHVVFCGVFAFASLTAGGLGVLLGSTFAYISPTLGNMIGDLALAAVLASGMGSIAGVLAVSLFMGIAESMATAAGYSSFISMVPFVVIILVLLIRPNGLFGAVTEGRN